MKFQDAKNRLKKLANGKYHEVSFALGEHSDGTLRTQVWLYVEKGHSSGFVRNFDIAFAQLEKELELTRNDEAHNEEIPQEVAA